MSDIIPPATNFIRQIIDADLASGKCAAIHTRFPPEPNGHLHIGHAKAICLNFGLALDYQGSCYLRFDDTNPTKEEMDYVQSIKNDVRWLGFKWDKITYSSDYFEQLYQCALELINKGLAYVDELSLTDIVAYRGTLTTPGHNSPYRDRSIDENLKLFAAMRAGQFAEGSCSLRAKIDMASPFIVMRDPVLYRIKFSAHHQTGTKWCIYPMYDFAHCICDALENITHSLCTLEFQDNRRLYDWILGNLTLLAKPKQYEFSRLNLSYTVTSKRKLHLLVDEKLVDGWDDPRMPTISGLRRRGYTPSSIRDFCRRVGITKQDNLIEMSLLEFCVREDLNNVAPRSMAVIDPIRVVIENFPADLDEVITMPNHPDKAERGHRESLFTREIYIDRADFRTQADKNYKRLVLGKEVRLRYAYIIRAERIEQDDSGHINTIYCVYDKETLNKAPSDGRKVRGVIHWISAKNSVPAEFHLYDRLFDIPDPSTADTILSVIHSDSLIIKHGFVERHLKNAKPSQTYQFEREGYFCLDSKNSDADHLVFNRTVTLRSKL